MFTIPDPKRNTNQMHTKFPPHSCSNSYHQEHQQQQMLVKIQRKRHPHTLLVRMQANTTTMENSMEVP
jgi:hypothetical protein